MDIPPAVFLPDEMIAEILSYLNVKTLMRMRSVSKVWKTLISNPTFVNLHLQKSSRNTLLTLLWWEELEFIDIHVLTSFPVRGLLENPSIIIDDYVELKKGHMDSYPSYRGAYQTFNRDGEYNEIVGSYNGLVCFYSRKVTVVNHHRCSKYSFYFRNLAMGTISEELVHFFYTYSSSVKFSFGYDNSTGTYKLVAFRSFCQHNSRSWTSEVKVFSLGDNNSWRKIQSFPVLPLTYSTYNYGRKETQELCNAVHLIGTINWLALGPLHDSTYINTENLVILSLSLSTETYTQLLLPKGLNEVLHACPTLPTLRVLRNCLCFFHDFRGTEFVVWQMREFGVRESWTQLIKVSYQTLQIQHRLMGDHMYDIQLQPFYLSENSDTLIFAHHPPVFELQENDSYNVHNDRAIIYNCKDDRVERTIIWKNIRWYSTMDYVESLVPIT